MVKRPNLNEVISEILLEKVKPKLKHTFNEIVFIEDTPPYDDVKGSRYYITAYVVDKRTLGDEIRKYIEGIKEASKYLTELSKAETQLTEGKTIWLNSYVKLFKKCKKIYMQSEEETPEEITIIHALTNIRSQIAHYQHVLSTNFIESIGEDTYNTLINENSLLLQKSKIGISFWVSSKITDKKIIQEMLNKSINALNKKAKEYYSKIGSAKIYNKAVSELKKLSFSNIRIPRRC